MGAKSTLDVSRKCALEKLNEICFEELDERMLADALELFYGNHYLHNFWIVSYPEGKCDCDLRGMRPPNER